MIWTLDQVPVSPGVRPCAFSVLAVTARNHGNKTMFPGVPSARAVVDRAGVRSDRGDRARMWRGCVGGFLGPRAGGAGRTDDGAGVHDGGGGGRVVASAILGAARAISRRARCDAV